MSQVIKLSSPATREFWEIPILFEDEHLLALDKPAQLLTSPDRNDQPRASLIKLLHAGIERGAPWAKERHLTYLMNAHRQDAETSGVLLFAKNKTALVTLANLFGSNKPIKKYVVLVRGTPEQDQFVVDTKLSSHPARAGLMRIDSKGGKKSETRFEIAEKFSGWTLLNCFPLTERLHQIRVHLKHAGFPVVADNFYGGKPLWLSRLKKDYKPNAREEERPLISRAAVHAEQLTVAHPATNETVTITAPLPKDFSVGLKYLRKYAA